MVVFIENIAKVISDKELQINIVSNNCVGARIYGALGIQYPNPFMWNNVKPNEYIKLIEKFDEIDFRKYKVELRGDIAYIIVDNTVELPYVHYRYDSRKEEIEKKEADIFYNKIVEYAEEKYKSRVERMYEHMDKEIVFLLHANYYYTSDDVLAFINAKTKHKKVLYCMDENLCKKAKEKGIISIVAKGKYGDDEATKKVLIDDSFKKLIGIV